MNVRSECSGVLREVGVSVHQALPVPGPCSCLEQGYDLEVKEQEGDLGIWGAPSAA